MGHIPSGFIRSGKLALKLFGRHTLFSRTNQVDCQKPLSQSQMRIVKDSPDSYRVIVFAIDTLIEMAHFAGFALGFIPKHAFTLAFRANQTIRPAYALKMFDALFLSVEAFDNLENGRGLIHG